MTLTNSIIDPAHLEMDFTVGVMTQAIWADKYKWEDEANFFNSIPRIVDGIFANDLSTEAGRAASLMAQEYMKLGLLMPAGRIMAGAGTDKVVTLLNCFSGDEKFVTKEHGIISFRDATSIVTVLTAKGWIKAEVKSFGEQLTYQITLVPRTWNGRGGQSKYTRTVYATKDHRWILMDGTTTTNLKVNDQIKSVAYTSLKDGKYRDGFKHGFIFGDGTHSRTTLRDVGEYPEGTMHFNVRLCGKKAENYLPMFEGEKTSYHPANNGDPTVYMYTDIDLKALPTETDPDYLAGFIEGWNAADGSTGESQITGTNSIAIFSKNRNALSWLANYAPYAGYSVVGNRRYSSGVTNYGGVGELWVCTLRKANDVVWEVQSIEEWNEEEVYCAVVPGEAAFTLAGGIYTGNCFVNGTIGDNMESIADHLKYTMLTMQQGGGMGTAFETIRPDGAVLKRTGKGSKASGPLPFMDTWNSAGITIESAGGRRGAQMGTISDTHPDMPAFVVAKRTPGRLTNFNVSVLISDAFMEAKADDAEWLLYFHVPPVTRKEGMEDYDFVDDEGTTQYVYSVWKARDLWKLITENTYEYSEPGIIFIDRVNELNNLHYLEQIRATNPCGEQPLPPHNACDLGHVVLARMVRNPFTEEAVFDFDLLRSVVRVLQRFLDNVWDVTRFPLEEQREECLNKRRTGLGFTGLADVFIQMGYRYGGAKSADLAERIMQTICEAAYDASVDLAIEKGSFPLFDADKFLAPNTFAGSRLPTHLQERIRAHGIRNGVLLTLAPTGTSSIVFGNPQGGLEPFFALEQKRKVLKSGNPAQGTAVYDEYVEYPYAISLWWKLVGKPQEAIRNDTVEYPPYFNTIKDLTIHDHILIQSRCQRWVDASISKTTNIPKEMDYDDFVQVYDIAYASGCKGCTTYRPSGVRGSVLEDAADSSRGADDKAPANTLVVPELAERPDILHGTTYKIKWPRRNSSLYLTINSDEAGIPFEVFLTSKDGSASEWTTALSLMITGIYRKGGDVKFVGNELQQIQSVNDGAFMFDHKLGRNRMFSSLPSYIGYLLDYHMERVLTGQGSFTVNVDGGQAAVDFTKAVIHFSSEDAEGEQCPKCLQWTLINAQGCKECTNCSYSHCG